MSGTKTPPPVEGRTVEQFAIDTARLVQRYTGRPPAESTPEPALVRLFARFAEVVADRLNRAPDRNFVAFLDMLGLELLPPQPARAPVTFSLAAGVPGDAAVPAGTQLTAMPLGAEKDPVVFETEQDLLVSRTELALAFTRDPLRDAYASLGPVLASGGTRTAPLFVGDLPVRHLLYLSFTDLAVKGAKTVTLSVVSERKDVPWPRYVQWTTFDGAQRQVLPMAWNEERWELTFALPGALTPYIVDGRSEPWIQGSFTLPLRRAAAPAQLATDPGKAAEPGTPFEAFGPSGKGALVVCPGTVPAGARLALDVDVASAGTATEVAWEYSSAADGGWTELGRSRAKGGGDGGVTDGTAALSRSGRVELVAPADWVAAVPARGGAAALCLRVRPVGSFDGVPASPVVNGVLAGYELTVPPIDTVQVRIEMHAEGLPVGQAFANQAPVDLTKDFFPFGERPRFGDTFYFTVPDLADKPGAKATLNVTLTNPANPSATPPPANPVDVALRWEFWNRDAARWEPLGESGTAAGLEPSKYELDDPTKGFSVQEPAAEPAAVTFVRPPTMGETEVNGVRGAWLRVRITGGSYGADSSYVQVKGEGEKPDSYVLVPSTLHPPSVKSVSLSYVQATDPADPLSAVTDTDFKLVDRTPAARLGGQTFAPFEAGGDGPALYLGFRRPGADRAFGDGEVTLYAGLEEARYAGGGPARAAVPASVAWEWWNGTAWQWLDVRDGTQGFTRRGTVAFVPPATMRLSSEFGEAAYWVRARLASGEYAAPPRLTRLALNTTWAEQRETVRGETLGSSNGERSQAFRTARTPVLPGAVVEVREPTHPSGPEADALRRDEGAGAVREQPDAAGEDTEIWVRWHRVADFLASGPRDRHYTLDWSTGEVRFGDGVHGMIPPEGRSNVRAAGYRVGGGPQGNRPAGNVAQLRGTVPYVDRVTNPEPAAGGSDAESMDSLRVRGPRTLRHRDRAVALADYEDLGMAATTEVARAWAIPPESLAAAGSVELLVVPRSDEAKPVPSVELLERVQGFVGARAPSGVQLGVAGPRWLSVAVQAEVVASDPAAARGLPDAIAARIDEFLHPLTGGPSGTGWDLGRRPYRSELFALVEGAPGVDHLRSLRMTMMEDGADRPPDDYVPDRLLVYAAAKHDITVA